LDGDTAGFVHPIEGQNLKLIVTASALMIFGIFFMRYDLVIVGTTCSGLLRDSDGPQMLSYTPSAHEILIVLGGIGLCLTFLLGEKIFSATRAKSTETDIEKGTFNDIK